MRITFGSVKLMESSELIDDDWLADRVSGELSIPASKGEGIIWCPLFYFGRLLLQAFANQIARGELATVQNQSRTFPGLA